MKKCEHITRTCSGNTCVCNACSKTFTKDEMAVIDKQNDCNHEWRYVGALEFYCIHCRKIEKEKVNEA